MSDYQLIATPPLSKGEGGCNFNLKLWDLSDLTLTPLFKNFFF